MALEVICVAGSLAFWWCNKGRFCSLVQDVCSGLI